MFTGYDESVYEKTHPLLLCKRLYNFLILIYKTDGNQFVIHNFGKVLENYANFNVIQEIKGLPYPNIFFIDKLLFI